MRSAGRASSGACSRRCMQEREQLDGLAEAHVVGETSAEPELRKRHQPVEPARLVRPQGCAKAARRRQRIRATPAQAVQHLGERAHRGHGDGERSVLHLAGERVLHVRSAPAPSSGPR